MRRFSKVVDLTVSHERQKHDVRNQEKRMKPTELLTPHVQMWLVHLDRQVFVYLDSQWPPLPHLTQTGGRHPEVQPY